MVMLRMVEVRIPTDLIAGELQTFEPLGCVSLKRRLQEADMKSNGRKAETAATSERARTNVSTG
jgi:hypothetical protein